MTPARVLAGAGVAVVLVLTWYVIDQRGLPLVAGCVLGILVALGGWEHLEGKGNRT